MSITLRFVFLFKQKTANEMRISDWSSDVCSSDLAHRREKLRRRPDMGEGVRELAPWRAGGQRRGRNTGPAGGDVRAAPCDAEGQREADRAENGPDRVARTRVRYGKRVVVRVDLAGRRIIYKTTKPTNPQDI